MDDKPMHEIIFVGRLRWRYRWRAVRFALKALWRALDGFEVSILSRCDAGGPGLAEA